MIGIDLGGTHFNVGLVAPDGPRVTHRAGGRTPIDEGPPGVVRALCEGIRDILRRAGVNPDDLAGIGVAAPGAVDHAAGLIHEAPNLRWSRVPLRGLLAAALGIDAQRVVVENDVNAALLGEHTAGAARGMHDAVGIWVGTGVGGAIMLAGRLHRGTTGSAGEIGQTILLPNGTADTRVMEMVCSRRFVQQRIATLIAANRSSALTDLLRENDESLGEYSAATLAKAYHAGDPLVTASISEAADLLGVAIANALTLLGITNVILGGGMTEALGTPYLRRIEASIKVNAFPAMIAEQLAVRATELHADAGIIGGAMAAAPSS